MINVKIIKKPKGNISTRDNGIATNGNGYRTGAVTKEAVHAARADLASYAENAGMADNATHADEAEHAKSAFDIDADSPVREEFLSKVKDDRTSHKLSSDKGFEAGEYLAGVSGGIFGMDAAGDSFAEVARLYVRVKAFFEELTVVKARVLAGKQYTTPGGGIRCTRVEETAGAWRCWFLSEQDGEKTGTSFITKDQAISEMFNAVAGTSNKVSNHRYWRLVTAVENDALTDKNGNHYGYIDLSKTDCEPGSDTPKAGDEICQLGYRGTDNPQRQTAMVFSTVDADAPSVKLYGGIDSFSLEGKAVVLFGRDPQSGKIFFRLGTSGARQYLEYTQDGGLKVAGSISAESTWDDGSGIDRTLKDVVEDKVVDTDVLFRLHTSRTDAPVLPVPGPGGTIANPNGWQTEAPEGRPGMYMWQTTYVRRGDGTAEFRGTSCVQGKDAAGYSPNLLVDTRSRQAWAANSDWGYVIIKFDAPVGFKAGDTYTLSVGSIENLAGTATKYDARLYDRGTQKDLAGGVELTPGRPYGTFTIKNPCDAATVELLLYAGKGGSTSGNAVRYTDIMLAKGDMPTAWSPAISEMKGAQGTAAKVVVLNSDATAFTYSGNFATLTGPEKITLSAAAQGIDSPSYGWSYKFPGDTGFTPYNGLTGSSIEVSAAWGEWRDRRSVTWRCTVDGAYDEVTLVKVSSGAKGEPGAGYTENLLLKSGEPVTTDTYLIKRYDLGSAPSHGDDCTLTIWGGLAEGPSGYHFSAYNSGTMLELCALEKVSDGVYSARFKWRNYINSPSESWAVAEPKFVNIYAKPGSGLENTITRIKLEHGSNDSPVWSPAPSEQAGKDAYTVVLSNESHIFEGDTEKAVAGSTECGITAYRGATRVPATVDTIGGIPTGMTCTVRDNGGEAARIEVAVTPSLTQRQGVLDVPVTVDGQAFIKKFSWSLSLAGAGHSPNLLLKSESADTFTAKQPWGPTVTRYLDGDVRLSVGDTLSLSVGTIERLAGDAEQYEMFLFDKAANKAMHPSVRLTASDRRASFRLTHVPADMKDCAFYMYAGLNGQQTGNHVVYGKIMLVKGDMPAAWSPAVSEQAAPVFAEQYYQSESRLELRGGTGGTGGWHDTKPQPQTGRHYWTRTKTTYGDGTIEYTEPVCAAPEPGYTDNLLPGTRDWRGWDTGTSARDGEYRGLEVLHCDNSASQWLLNMASYDGVGLENGRAYTMSFYARGTGRLSSYLHPDVSARVYFQDGTPVSGNTRPDTWTERTLTGEWRRYCAVFHTAASGTLSGRVFLIRAEAGCDAWVAGAKLEEGENPSPQWSPAPGELAAEPAYVLDLDTETAPVACDAFGNPLSTGVLATSAATVYRGAATDTGWTLAAAFTGCGGTLDTSTGLVQVTSVTADRATVAVTATKAGHDTLTAVMSLFKVRPGADGAAAVIYTIEPAVSNITKSVNGELTNIPMNMLGCRKYKTVGGASRQETFEKCLAYRHEGQGVDTTEKVLSASGTAATAMATVDPRAEAVVFTLYDGDDRGVVLYRERVPVIADFGGLALSGDNLALDTATAWQLGGGKLKGTNPHALYGTEDIAGGTTVTVSFDYDITGLTFGTGGYIVVCGSPYFRSVEMSRRFAANGSGHSKATVTLGSTVASQKKEIGTRIKTVSVTGAASDAHVRITNFKVEKGPYETPWRPNARDYSYIAEALRQGGSMEAGIVLTRLLQLGYTDASGTFRTTAGMNGLVRDPSDPRDLAIWTGGDPGEHMDASRVAMGWFHDGTGFAAHNTIRFKERTVELGEGMELTDREMCLKDEDGNRRYVISRDSVGTPEDYLTDSRVQVDGGVFHFQSPHDIDLLSDETGMWAFGADSVERLLGSYADIPAGSAANIEVSSLRRFVYRNLTSEGLEPTDEAWAEGMHFDTSVRVTFREQTGAEGHADIPYREIRSDGTSNTYEARGTASYTVRGAGTLAISVRLVPGSTVGRPLQETLFGGIDVGAQGVIGRRYDSQVRNCLDGWVCVWDTTAALVKDGTALLRTGDYGLRTDVRDGVLINRGDGRGWVPL